LLQGSKRKLVVTALISLTAVGLASRRRVKVSRYVAERALIETGLVAGERVIVSNLDALHDGTAITSPTEK